MPFKSKAQKAKFGMLVREGKMSAETYHKWESETHGPLPERAKKKPASGKMKQVKPTKPTKY